MILPTGEFFDHKRLYKEYFELCGSYSFLAHEDQIALTHSQRELTVEESLVDGTGCISGRYNGIKRDPAEFTVLNEILSGTYLGEVCHRVREWSSQPIGRIRLMRCQPHRCYSTHRDTTIRYHIALDTNPHCYFIFDHIEVLRVPDDGQLYAAMTLRWHTFVNAGESDRIHLVFDEIPV